MIKKLLIVLLFFSMLHVNGQSLNFEHYGLKDGLSQSSIRNIVQDDHGFLWIATFGGVNRYDGYEFKMFKSEFNNSDFIHANEVVDMELDSKSNLWVGTTFGLFKYNIPSATNKKYNHNPNDKNSLAGDEIRTVYLDKSNRLWVGTKFDGICFYDDKKDSFHSLEVENVRNVRAIQQSQDGRYWFSTFNKGIFSFELSKDNEVIGLKNHKLISKEESIIPEIYFLFEDKKFDLFAGTKKGVFKLNKLKSEFELLPQKNDEDYFRCITKGPNDNYWLGTLNGLIKCKNIEGISSGNYERYNSKNSELYSLRNNYILSLLFDKSGVLWIGTENGFEKYDEYDNQFKSISRNFSDHYSFPNVSSFAKTIDNKLLVGTHSNGLYINDNNDFKRIIPEYNNIASIYTVDNKVFYIGLWNGKIVKYNYQNNKKYLIDVGFKNSPIFSFYKINEDEFLIGAKGGGLISYNFKSKKSRFVNKEKLGKLDINKIVKALNNIFWIATEDGVYRLNYETEEIKFYKSEVSELSNDRIKDIVIDKKGKVWAGTRQGLKYYDPISDSFKVEIENVNLYKNWVTDIAIDSTGIMWLNMNYNQLGKYNPKEKKFRLFYVNNGIRSNAENKKGFLLFDNSKIYIGGDNEIIYFSPSKLRENKVAPLPIISEFKIQNKIINPGTEVNGEVIMKEELNYSKKVDLSYQNRNFSIKFSVPSFVKENRNEFKYKLEGVDNGWHTVNNNSRTIQYVNLFPDEYVLRIKASNNDGYWSETVSYNINIAPPFWLTYKAFLLFVLILSVLIYIVRKQINNRLKLKNALLMEKVKRERDEKLNNEKLRFFTNISHELRTPLTLIIGPVKQLLDKQDKTEYEKSRFKLIDQNAMRLLQLVNQILDFRRAQTGELKLKVSKREIVNNTKSIFSSFNQLADDKQISYSFNSELEKIEGWIDADKYNKILFNLLSNALKFTKNYGTIDLFLGISEDKTDRLIIEISDDGIGIPKKSQNKVFDRFYQASNSKANTTGTGIGLSLVQSLVKLHKGKITLVSEVDKGTTFTVEIPFCKECFSEKEIFELPSKPVQEKSKKVITKVKHSTEVKQRILLIDDNVEVRKFLVDYLSDAYKVYEADNGKEGLQVCRKIKPDLCVVDVMMPIMDGFKFVEELKADENISNTAIVMLTALSENENKIKGYSIGVDGYLVKPFDTSLLKTRIENILKIRGNLKQQFSGEVESDVTALAHSQIDVELISKLTELIKENISNPELSSTFLCEQLAMSSSKLYRKIKQLTDLSPNEFIRTVRLKKSAILLKTKNHNVSEVATMVGFNDPLYFSRVFKKQFGYSPSKLIK